MSNITNSTFTIASIGDVSFEGSNADHPDAGILSATAPIFRECDLVIANLEGPLTNHGYPVKNKCTLRGSPKWADILKESGISLVSLANNHLMDYGPTGLHETQKALKKADLLSVGAGESESEAHSARVLSLNGNQIAIFARSSVIVSSPGHATNDRPGVAYFNIDALAEQVDSIKGKVNFIVLVLHWGLEEYIYPSPQQLVIAKRLLNSGVDLILGHHPHVLQGVRLLNKRMVSFSMGNFLFDEFKWSYIGKDGLPHESLSILSEANRKSGILKINCSRLGVESYEFIPMRIAMNGVVTIDDCLSRQKEFQMLSSRINYPGYGFLWKLYALSKEFMLRVVPVFGGRITWQRLKKIRLKHIHHAFDTIKKSLRITSEKTTNPYE